MGIREINSRLDKWERINLPEPKNDYERVRAHYIGCCIWKGKNNVVLNILAFPVIILAWFFSYIRRDFDTKASADAVIYSSDVNYIPKQENIPDTLIQLYPDMQTISHKKPSIMRQVLKCRLDSKGHEIMRKLILRYPFSFYMNLYVLLHISFFYRCITEYNPKAIISTLSEQDFASSMLTYYCESKSIRFICIQHGIYCYNPSMAYMRFSEYYAWNKETIDVLELTNSKIDFAHVYTPDRMKKKYNKVKDPEYFIAYYLSDEDVHDVKRIKDILLLFVNAGYRCKIRRHPHRLNDDIIHDIFKGSGITCEDTKSISIGESLSNTDFIVSYQSTVLTEGFINDMAIVVDDISGDINMLIRIHDINVQRASLRLSNLVEKYL